MWFQNRRTKQKKDQGKDSELRSVVSETAATCSVLRLLEQGRLLTPPGLPGLLSHCGSSSLGSALRGPSLGITANGGSSSSSSSSAASSGTAGGSPPLPTVTSSGTVTGLQGSPPAHGLFSFPMPSLLGSVASRISSAPLAMAGSLAGNLQELSARYLSSSAFEPYSRTNGKEALDKKVLEWSLGVSFCQFVVVVVVLKLVWALVISHFFIAFVPFCLISAVVFSILRFSCRQLAHLMSLRIVKRWTHTFQKRGFSEHFALNQSFSNLTQMRAWGRNVARDYGGEGRWKWLLRQYFRGTFFPLYLFWSWTVISRLKMEPKAAG